WAIEEYASRRLRLFWVRAARLAPVIVMIETKISNGTQIFCNGYRPMTRMRSSIVQAAAFTATDMKPVMLVGAPSYASGAHWWNGTAEILKKSPAHTVTRAKTAIGST